MAYHLNRVNVQESQKHGCPNTIMNGTAFFDHALIFLSTKKLDFPEFLIQGNDSDDDRYL